MDEGTAQHGLDPEVRLGNHETMHDTKMKLGLDENWTNRSPKKADTLVRSRLVVEYNFTCRQFLIRNLFALFRCRFVVA